MREMTPNASPSIDRIYFYWSVNSNCGITGNLGFPFCRTNQAPNATENPASVTFVYEDSLGQEITGLTTGTQYYFNGYLFWANWDSSYKFRVEVWDSAYSTQITAFNLDTSSGGTNYGLTTSGMNGYVTLAAQRSGGSSLTPSGIQLAVSSIEMVQ